MKHFTRILTILVMAATAFSCAKENALTSTKDVNDEHVLSIGIESGTYKSEDATKASTEAVVRVSWTEGDSVSVINITTGKLLGGRLKAAGSGTVVKFSGTVKGAVSNGNKLIYVYPAIKGNTEEEAFETCNFDLSSQTYDPGTKEVVFYGYAEDTWDGSASNPTAIDRNIKFNLATSYVHLNMSGLTASDSVRTVTVSNINGGFAWDIEGTEFKIKEYKKNAGISLSCKVKSSANGNAIVRFAVPASDAADERTLSVNNTLSTNYATAARVSGSYYNQLYSNFTNKVTVEKSTSTKTEVVINDPSTANVAANLTADDTFKQDDTTAIVVGGVGEVTFDAAATNKIKENAAEESATSVFFKVENVTEKATSEPNEVVYEITMKTVDDKGTEVFPDDGSTDARATIKVALPNAESVEGVSLLAGTEKTSVPEFSFDSETHILSFTVNHFSNYAIDYTPYEDLVAETGGRQYPTLEAAISAAKDGHTVTLLKNYQAAATIEIDKSLTVNLGSCTLTAACTGYLFDLRTEEAGKSFKIAGKSGTEYGHIASNGTEGHVGLAAFNGSAVKFEMSYVSVHGATENDSYIGEANTNKKCLINDYTSASDLVKLTSCTVRTTSVVLGGEQDHGAAASVNIKGGSFTCAKGFRYAGTEKSVIDGATITVDQGIAIYPYSDTELKNSFIYDNASGNLNHDAISVGGKGSELVITSTTVRTVSKTAVAAENLGTATINGGDFASTCNSLEGAVLRVNNTGGQIDVHGGTFDGSESVWAVFTNTKAKSYPDDPAGISIYGGTFTGGSSGMASVSSDHATVEIHGGTYTTPVTLVENSDQWVRIKAGCNAVFNADVTSTTAVNIPGGTFKESIEDGDLGSGSTITGGTFFEAEPFSGYVPSGYNVVEQSTSPVSWKVESVHWSDYTAADFSSVSGKTVTITSAAEFALLAKNINADVNYTGYTFKLGADIDLSAHDWDPIMLDENCATNLTLDGYGKTISGLRMTRDDNFSALFGTYFSHGTVIKNITISNPQIVQSVKSGETGLNYTAALVAHMGCGVIDSCTVTGGSVAGQEQVGALVGYLACGTIKNCTVNGNISISGANRVGGITGKTNCDSEYHITGNSISDATVISTGKHGICGAAAIVGQIMTGTTWTISGNDISNVSTTTGSDNKFVPIGEFRAGEFAADAVSGGHIVDNSWETAKGGYYDMVNPSNTSEYVRILNASAQ